MNWTLFQGSSSAHQVATLWWWMLAFATLVWIAVVAAMFMAIRRRRPAETEALGDGAVAEPLPEVPKTESPATYRALTIAFGVTIAILFGFMVYDFAVGKDLPHHSVAPLNVTVRSHQWWWEFNYEDTVTSKHLTTANELHVPVGTPVHLTLEAPDVIHSFWAPMLSGKQDLIPGYRGGLTITADTAGTYKGWCAEFCGAQHANMRFIVVAQSKKDFEKWWAAQQQPQSDPTDSLLVRGQRAFLSAACATCHTIDGTNARGQVAPNLTHLGSRTTIAAGARLNNRENLLQWIYNPQLIKPGSLMPAANLPPQSLAAVVAYLESLK
jgi:cytochrome c oxidase subunit 2